MSTESPSNINKTAREGDFCVEKTRLAAAGPGFCAELAPLGRRCGGFGCAAAGRRDIKQPDGNAGHLGIRKRRTRCLELPGGLAACALF